MKPDTTPPRSSGRIEGQLDIDEAIRIAETGSDGKPTTAELNRKPCVVGEADPERPIPCCGGCICTCGTDFPFDCECHR